MTDAATASRPLAHVTDWVFDLDNTLYPRSCNLFAQIDVLITDYVMRVTGLPRAAARKLQKDYYRDHGTTLNALMKMHGVDPEDYLSRVHAIDYAPVPPAPQLVAVLRALPGRKFIFTNADSGHAEKVLARLGAGDLFDGIFDIRAAAFEPKPAAATYERFLARHGVAPERAVMFDDLEKNLHVPHEIGMATVQVTAEDGFADAAVETWERAREDAGPHVHHRTSDLTAFLGAL